MKKVPCAYEYCKERRVHFTLPDIARGVQFVEVKDDYEGKAYCSLTCALLAGDLNEKSPEEEKQK